MVIDYIGERDLLPKAFVPTHFFAIKNENIH
jgi:hypothetical protein